MDRFIKINVFVFSLISFISILLILLKNNEKIITLAAIVLVSNSILMVLFIMLFHNLIKINRGYFVSFVFWIIFSTFIYWYVISSILHYTYGTFLSLSGVYFFIVTTDTLEKILFYIGSVIIISLSSLVLTYFTRKRAGKIIKKNIEKIEDNIVIGVLKFDRKVVRRKMKLTGTIIIILLFFYVGILTIPTDQSKGATPITDFTQWLDKDIEQNYTFVEKPINESGVIHEKLFDIRNKSNLSVIIIMLESISRDRMPQYGYERDITPNIDKLAEDSIIFNNAFSTSTHSDYAQPSFLSSRYTLIGRYRNFFDMDYKRIFLWDVLKREGYSTAYISSQDDEWANMISYYNTENLDIYSYSLTDGTYDYGTGNAKKDYDEVTINKSTTWLENISEPLFLYVNLQATHYPYSYPPNNSLFNPHNVSSGTSYFKIGEGDYNNSVNNYDNSLFYVDRQVGVLLDLLKEKGVYNNSIIVLTSDHGETLDGEHGYLRHGFGVYREENMVPLFIKIPGQEHKLIEDNVKHIDVLPTILDILNLTIPEEMQGHPIGEKREIFVFSQNQNFKIGIIKNNFKYVIDMNNYVIEAYNLTLDPYEKENLEDGEGIKFTEYRDRLLDWYNCQALYYRERNWEETISCD